MDHFSRKIVFQRAYFRGYVRFSGRITGDGSEILHQLRLVVYPIIYRVSAPSQEGFSPKIYLSTEVLGSTLVWELMSQPVCSPGLHPRIFTNWYSTKNGIFFFIYRNHHFPTIILGYPAVSFQGCRLRDPYKKPWSDSFATIASLGWGCASQQLRIAIFASNLFLDDEILKGTRQDCNLVP